MAFESVKKIAEADFPTRWGRFRIMGFEGTLESARPCCEHGAPVGKQVEGLVALVMGDVHSAPPLIRIHSQCLTGDVFGSLRCDCGPQLAAAMAKIGEEGMGVLVYLRGHEGRGIGIHNKLLAYELQDNGMDTVEANLHLGLPADSREYGIGSQILVDLGITTMRYMTNNPAKYGGLEGFGLEMVERVPLQTVSNPENLHYLRTKREKMGHLLDGLDDDV